MSRPRQDSAGRAVQNLNGSTSRMMNYVAGGGLMERLTRSARCRLVGNGNDMRRTLENSVALTAVDAFMATAAYESYAEAGKQLGLSPTTVMRQVIELEEWLRRVLIWSGKRFCTDYGNEFVPIAGKIITLIDSGGLRNELKKTRVYPDGVVTIEGQPINSIEAREIGELMVQSRAAIGPVEPALGSSDDEPENV